jgi:hypothetical protein
MVKIDPYARLPGRARTILDLMPSRRRLRGHVHRQYRHSLQSCSCDASRSGKGTTHDALATASGLLACSSQQCRIRR